MKQPRKKKIKTDVIDSDNSLEDLDDTRPVRFEALAELTSSEVVAQVKLGMSQISEIGELEEDEVFELDDQSPDDQSEEQAA